MRGRKPKPTARKRLEGNPGHRPFNRREPQPPIADASFDQPPAALTDHPIAILEWTRLAPLLRRARQVSEADRAALVALCLEWDRYLEAMAQVQKRGMVFITPAGYPQTNPYVSIATRALQGCLKLWPELGLTPSSRSRVTTTSEPDPADPFAEFDAPAAVQ
jgi:P27 family predicted phage terminase small subunit